MNIIEFAEKYGIIRINNELVNCIELQDYEKDFLGSLVENKLTATVASRQMHMSTLLSVYITYNLIFGENETIAILDTKMDLVANKMRNVNLMLNHYMERNPNSIDYKINNKTKLKLSNENSLIGVVGIGGFCGYRFTKIIIDNAAFIDNLNSLYSTILPMVGSSGSVHMVSCPNQIEFFHSIYSNPNNSFKKNAYHYSLNSRYTPERINEMRTYLSKAQWRQEMEMEFFIPERPQRNRTLQVRVDGETYIEVTKRLVQLDMNISEYLYDLIYKDLQGA